MKDSPRHNVGSVADPHYVVDEEHYLKAVADADHFFLLSGKYLERANEAEAQRDKALVALNAIKEYWKEDITDRAMFDACWFAKNIAESVLKECWKPKVEK